MLLEAGHSVVGIDQSAGMLARARERCPEAHYVKMALQEMDFREAFDGVTCIHAMEHVCLQDWPGILGRFREALKPGGALYFIVDLRGDHVEAAYERAKAQGLPVVFGEVVDEVAERSQFSLNYENVFDIPEEALGERADLADLAVYHCCPSLEQVRAWIREAGLVVEEQGWNRPH